MTNTMTDTFIDIRNNKKISFVLTGKSFEKKIKKVFLEHGFMEIVDKEQQKLHDFLQANEKTFQSYTDETTVKNDLFDKAFIYQPFGTQKTPDFLVFNNGNVYAIECKHSIKQEHPVWNACLPKINTIYIFGNSSDITFFNGKDLVSKEERIKIKEIWENLETLCTGMSDFFKDNSYGFAPVIRRSYTQTRKFNKKATISFFKNEKRNLLEENVLEFFKNN